jgi:c(7)-type cytochrome triheme protein
MACARPSRPPILPAAVAACLALLGASGRPDALRLPPGIAYDTAPGSPGPVTFSHETHVALSDNKCLGCHPAPFRMLRPSRKVSHAEMEAGRVCGACHDGKTASGVRDDCAHCHQPPDAAPEGGRP